MSKRVVALIPLRGGSRGIPGKNIKLLAGKPLCAWSIEAACAASKIDEVFVSTDSPEIRRVVDGLGVRVKVIDRPAEFATDTASTESVMVHFAKNVPFDVLVTLQATSPLTRSIDIDSALETMSAEKWDSFVTVARWKRFLWSKDGTALNYDVTKRPRRQDFDGMLVENGAFYGTTRSLLEKSACRLGGRIGVHEMPEDTLIEIDEPSDWDAVARILADRQLQPAIERAAKVRVLVLDVDGTLTDGGMYCGDSGERLKRFDTRDGHGISMLKAAGVETVMMTREPSPIAISRAQKLGIECHAGVRDKLACLEKLCQSRDLDPRFVGFMGDDLPDLDCLKRVGFAACPADAMPPVLAAAHYVAKRGGGRAAVREVCDFILSSQDISSSTISSPTISSKKGGHA